LRFGEMSFVSAEIGNYELEAMLLLGKGVFHRLQLLVFTRKFLFQMTKCHVGIGGQRVPLSQSW
jgi:hypothetical protein